MFSLKKLTDCKWLNLFEVLFTRDRGPARSWIMVSRKERPIADAGIPDAVVIIPILKTPAGNRLVVTREFRVPIWDYEYGFCAGLIDDGENIETTIKRELAEETGLELIRIISLTPVPVYSSAGMSDESCHMAIVECAGSASKHALHPDEDIDTLLMDAGQVKDLLKSKSKIAAKAWGIFYHFAALGQITVPGL
jgi:ADP-ribose pyrophosphatase